MKTIGVLAFQGGVIEHVKKIEELGAKPQLVKKKEDLKDLDGLILPGEKVLQLENF